MRTIKKLFIKLFGKYKDDWSLWENFCFYFGIYCIERNLKRAYNETKYFFKFVWARIRGKYTYYEIADLNTTFCKFMLPRLKEFRRLEKIYGVTFEEDYQKYEEDPNYQKDLEKNSEKFDKEMDEMIFAMENFLDEDAHNPYEYHCGEMIIKDGKMTFGPITPAQEIETDLYIKTYQNNLERQKKGFELLGKRFMNLNDW